MKIDIAYLKARLTSHPSDPIEGIEFTDQTFSGDMLNHKSIITTVFKNCIFRGATNFNQLGISNSLAFEGCIFESQENDEELVFSNISGNTLDFRSGNIFSIPIKFTGINLPRFNFSGIAKKRIQFSNIQSLVISNNSILNDVTFSNCHGTNSILIRDSEINGNLAFHKSPGKSLIICDGKYSKISFNNIFDINYLRIEAGQKKQENLSITEFNFPFLNLTGKLELKYCHIKKFVMPNFDGRDGQFSMQGITINETLQMDDSNLSGSFFSDVNMFKSKLIFDRSNLNNSSFSNVKWPEHHEIQTLESSDPVISLTVKTEVYRQLKKLCKDNSNTFDALKFYRQEMDTYWQRVKIDKSEKKWNRFLIRVDRFASDFGQSYMRPIVIMMIIHLVLCICIWSREAYYHHYVHECSVRDFENGFGQYFTWLLPVFKTPEKWTSASIGISFFIRILNGFFIYHFIRATRKFSKL